MARGLLSIIIPAYNEKATLATLLDQVLAIQLPDLQKEIIVIESNSTDGTREIVKRYETLGRIRAIYQDRPRGKGHAVKTGFEAAQGDWILIQDADLEYDVADYPKLLAPLVKGETKFVLGSRHLDIGWAYRTHKTGFLMLHLINAASWGYTQIFNVLYGQSLTDPYTMFKVFHRSCLEGIHFQSTGFDMDLEIVAKFVRKGYQPTELAVSYHSRNWAEGKKVQLWRDGWFVLFAIVRYRFSAL